MIFLISAAWMMPREQLSHAIQQPTSSCRSISLTSPVLSLTFLYYFNHVQSLLRHRCLQVSGTSKLFLGLKVWTSTDLLKLFRIDRGLGYEFVLQLLNVSTNHIIAAVRNKETSVELQKLAALHPGRVDLVTMDVASTESVEKGTVETEALAAAKGGVDCVICNAGVLYGGWGTASEGLVHHYAVEWPSLSRGDKLLRPSRANNPYIIAPT